MPDRSKIRTNGDLVRALLQDEEAIHMKNADLAAFRKYMEQTRE